MLGELTASIAHEVNQPLTGMVSNASACLRWLDRDDPDLEEVREAVRDIARDGKRAGDVISRIRALAKRAPVRRDKLDLNEVLGEVLALVADEAKRTSVTIRTRLADDLSPVAGDRIQFQQVFLNLVLNAIEAMSSVVERELVITTRNIDPRHVQATFQDSGAGLDPNIAENLFQPFVTTKPGGMGMGLSISRTIVEKYGGRLWATANDGRGTTFYFTVPRYEEEQVAAQIATRSSR
jgi:signal transduction histidine kinase